LRLNKILNFVRVGRVHLKVFFLFINCYSFAYLHWEIWKGCLELSRGWVVRRYSLIGTTIWSQILHNFCSSVWEYSNTCVWVVLFILGVGKLLKWKFELISCVQWSSLTTWLRFVTAVCNTIFMILFFCCHYCVRYVDWNIWCFMKLYSFHSELFQISTFLWNSNVSGMISNAA
jgi:hypothetical protein